MFLLGNFGIKLWQNRQRGEELEANLRTLTQEYGRELDDAFRLPLTTSTPEMPEDSSGVDCVVEDNSFCVASCSSSSLNKDKANPIIKRTRTTIPMFFKHPPFFFSFFISDNPSNSANYREIIPYFLIKLYIY